MSFFLVTAALLWDELIMKGKYVKPMRVTPSHTIAKSLQ